SKPEDLPLAQYMYVQAFGGKAGNPSPVFKMGSVYPPFSQFESSSVQSIINKIQAMSKTITILLLLTLLGVFPVKSQPQEAVTDTVQLDNIVVTATKLPVSLKETIRPVTIITRKQIEQTSSANLSHLLQE